ncbi:unnamed protein product, partial [Ectocarpus fasciculatus]
MVGHAGNVLMSRAKFQKVCVRTVHDCRFTLTLFNATSGVRERLLTVFPLMGSWEYRYRRNNCLFATKLQLVVPVMALCIETWTFRVCFFYGRHAYLVYWMLTGGDAAHLHLLDTAASGRSLSFVGASCCLGERGLAQNRVLH